MFDFDNLREIWSTIRKNKLRTVLTGFSVSWGIFMLIVLLGAGNGFRNGVMYNFRNWSKNRIEVRGGYTTKPWEGLPLNRSITLKESDIDVITRAHPEIDLYSATIYQTDTFYVNKEYFTGQVNGVFPDHAAINYVNINAGDGRFINNLDMRESRKVIVLSPRMREVLFRDQPVLGIVLSPRMREVLFRDQPVLGQWVRVGKVMYQVIGIYEDDNMSNNAPAYIPFSTARSLYKQGDDLSNLTFTVKGLVSEEANQRFEESFRQTMGRLHRFDPTDANALVMWNMANEFRMLNNMMNAITLFLWVVGIGTLTAGIVGVSNIMLITVKERTREFGIRKAIGAKPASILGLIITESILVTAVFGYLGMVAGIGLTEAVSAAMDTANAAQATGGQEANVTVFRDPTVNLSIALSATALIIFAGVLAGYFPARKAVQISAIEAMRAE